MHTPLTLLKSVDAQLYGKIEYLHPSGSMKHRSIPAFIEDILKSGVITRDSHVAIRSAGAAAITTAWACAKYNIPVIAVLPGFAPDHFVRSLEWLGATVFRLDKILAEKKMVELSTTPNVYVLEQADEASMMEHYRVVAKEILLDLPDVKAIVVGVGTGLSVMGIAAEVKSQNADCAVYGTEPAEAPISSGGKWQPHNIPGLAPPRSRPLLDIDELAGVESTPSIRAWQMAKTIAHQEGLMIGPSSGATIAAALELRRQGIEGKIVSICACSIHEYLELSPIHK